MICTVLLSHDVAIGGWQVDIDGLVHTQRQAFRKQFPQASTKNGEATLFLTSEVEAELRTHQSRPPLHLVTSFLKQIAQFGYKVKGVDSTSDENGYRKTTLWTLQQKITQT